MRAQIQTRKELAPLKRLLQDYPPMYDDNVTRVMKRVLEEDIIGLCICRAAMKHFEFLFGQMH